MNLQGVILAAGKGTRLQPLTLTRSKAMAPIIGRPMVHWVFDTFYTNGIRDFIFVVSEADIELVNYFKENAPEDVKIEFAIQKERKGMAHALECAKDLINEDFILSACDSLVSRTHVRNLMNAYKRCRFKAALTLMEVEEERIPKTGIVEFNGDELITRIIEKPSIENAPSNVASLPLYVLSKDILELLPQVQLSPRGEYELQDAIQMLIDKYGPIQGLYADYRINLTNPNDLLQINLKFLRENHAEGLINSTVPQSTKINQPVLIEENVSIGENCEIGPNVYIESGCVVESGAKVESSIVLKGSTVRANSKVFEEVLL